MIPSFTPEGVLPEGIWESTLDEVNYHFATNLFRKRLFGQLMILIADLKKINCQVIYIDGSFITSKIKPNDIDVCWEENTGTNYLTEKMILPILFNPPIAKAVYGLDIFPARYMESDSKLLFIDFFQQVKFSNEKKGIIKTVII